MEQLEQLEQLEQRALTAAAATTTRPQPPNSARTLPPPPPPQRTRLLILQPTPFCNVRCSYCYLPDRDDRRRMSVDTARLAAQRLVEDGLVGEELTVVWHAGEPLAMPVSFYDEAVAAIGAALGSGCRVSHSIQTNGVLVDDAWCACFVRHGMRVGLSLDGPQPMHDAHRRTRHGRGTHARAMQAFARLRQHGIDVHVIAVVTAATLDDPEAFVEFFDALGASEVGCNFDELEGANLVSSLQGREAAHQRLLQQLMARAGCAGTTLRVRELSQATRLIAEPLPQYSWRAQRWPDNAQVLPWALISVGAGGDFATFSPELLGQQSAEHGDFVLGNVHRGGYLQAQRTTRFQALWSQVRAGVDACRAQCAHFGFCGGGSPVNKLYETGSFVAAETLYCRTMLKRPFDVALAWHEQRAAEAATNRTTE